MSFSDTELEALLSDLESDRAERKEALAGDAPEKARQAVCAFANDLPDHRSAGVVFIGARDDGAPSNALITDRLLTQLADFKTDGNILPPPSLNVEKRRLRGADMAVVEVLPSDSPPVRYKGRVYIRIGPRRGIATAQDERILNEKRRYRDMPFDVHPVPSASLDDINLRMFDEEYLPAAVARDVLEANERTREQRLAACKMIASADDPIPTILGLLSLGKLPTDWLPGAYVQFLRLDGTGLEDPVVDEQRISGPVSQLLRTLDDKLESHNRTAVHITGSSVESRHFDYPTPALQQITRNAVMHRTYEHTNAPVKVHWFADRIEILSPGGPFGVVTQENFGQPGYADYRNPNLAEVMKVLGFVQRFGAGISIARKALHDNGNPQLEFDVQPNAVLAVLRKAQA